MGWKEGDSLRKSHQGMNTNLQAYCNSKNVGVGATANLHRNLGWPKTNENFVIILKALRRYHQGGKTGMFGFEGPPTATTTATNPIKLSSSNAGSRPNLRRRECKILIKKEIKRRNKQEKRRGRGAALEESVQAQNWPISRYQQGTRGR